MNKLTICAISVALSLGLSLVSAAPARAQYLSHINEAGHPVCVVSTGWQLYEQLTPTTCFNPLVVGQYWTFEQVSDGPVKGKSGYWSRYRISSPWSGYCIDVTNRSSSVPEGTLLELNVCGNQNGVFWTLGASGPNGSVQLINTYNGKCMQSYGWSGTWLVLHTCANYTGQYFTHSDRFPGT